MKNLTVKKLTLLASILRDKGLYKQASLVQSMADNEGITDADDALTFLKACESNGLTKTAGPPVLLWWALGVVFGGTAVTSLGIAMSDDARDVMNDLKVTDFEREDAEELFERYYALLAKTDLIDGAGTFPYKHHMGGRWMRDFIRKYWDKKKHMTEDDFEDSISDEDHWGNALVIPLVRYGLDNENGWVECFNLIVGLWRVNELVKAKEESDKKAAEAKDLAEAKEESDKKAAEAKNLAEAKELPSWAPTGPDGNPLDGDFYPPAFFTPADPVSPTPAKPTSSKEEEEEEEAKANAHKVLTKQVEEAKERSRKAYARKRNRKKRQSINGVVEED